MSTHDDTTPAGLFRLLRRLLEDHQRIVAHHSHMCPLCQDTERTIELLAEQLPDEDCPTCAVAPGADHQPYCPSWLISRVFQPGAAFAPHNQ